MSIDREGAVAALYTRLQLPPLGPAGSGVIKAFSRIFIDPEQLGPQNQPALELIADTYELFNPAGTRVTKQRGHPNVWLLHIDVVVYAWSQEGNTSPETQLNTVLDGIDDLLAFRSDLGDKHDPSNQVDTNLGGLVSRVSITGPVQFLAGAGAQQASVICPVEILMPS